MGVKWTFQTRSEANDLFPLSWKPHIDISSSPFSSRQQNYAIPLRLPAQLLLGGQWKWPGPPVQQQQLPARPWRLIRGGRADPTVPVLPVSPRPAEPRLPGEPELIQPPTTGLVLHYLTCFILIWNIRHKITRIARTASFSGVDNCWLCCWLGETHIFTDVFLVCLVTDQVTLFQDGSLTCARWSPPSGSTLGHGHFNQKRSFLLVLISSQKQFCGIIHPRFVRWHSRKRIKMSLK